MPEEKKNILNSAVDDTIRGLHLAAKVTSWVMYGNFVVGTGTFVAFGMAGNTAEMNTSGMVMYFTGLGGLALHWAATSPSSPIGTDAYNRAQNRAAL